MKKMLLVLAMATATTACAPAMMMMAARAYPPARAFGQQQSGVEPVPTGRWDNVMRLPGESTIDVLTANGVANVGRILDADIDSVRIALDGAGVRIARADVVRVDLVDLAGSEAGAVAREAARGALIGAGVVALVAGVIGAEAWPPPGEMLRAGAAIGGVSGGHAEIVRRAGRLIYLAPPPPSAAQPGSGTAQQAGRDRPGRVRPATRRPGTAWRFFSPAGPMRTP